jgi:hypothetical protein
VRVRPSVIPWRIHVSAATKIFFLSSRDVT